MQFKRAHHQAIANILYSLDSELLRKHCCLFGGGTAIALSHGEYRESVDMNFLVSDLAGFRTFRQLLTSTDGINAITRKNAQPVVQTSDIRADQYGIRTRLLSADSSIKFEIVLEGRITLDTPAPENVLCNVATLTTLDMTTTKLLANSDRWADDGIFNRDVIDLAMLRPSPALLAQAIGKASAAYGQAVLKDLNAAINRLLTHRDWLERCMQSMALDTPRAVLWKNIRSLQSAMLKL